jgi:hypothetical protein
MKPFTSIIAVARVNTFCMAGSSAGKVLISCRVCAARLDGFEEGMERGNGDSGERDTRSRRVNFQIGACGASPDFFRPSSATFLATSDGASWSRGFVMQRDPAPP